MTYRWDTPIRYIRGLGPQRSKELAKIKINTVGDLLEYSPLHYIYPGSVSIAEAKEGHVVIRAVVTKIRRLYGSTIEAILDDGTATCNAIWYHASYIAGHLHQGMTVTFWGAYKGGRLIQPRWTIVESSLANVYGGQYGTHHATIRAALEEVLAHVELPDRQDRGDRVSLYVAFHFPKDKGQQRWAFETLKFDECLMLQLALAERRRGREQVKGVRIKI